MMLSTKKRRKGFTLVETIICMVVLSIVVLGTTIVSAQVSTMKAEARNDVYLSTHNLNTMERLRQMVYARNEGEELLTYYGEDEFSSTDITTEVFLDVATWDDFRVYTVRIESKIVGYKQTLTSTYTLTDIGSYKTAEVINNESDDDGNVTLS